MDFAQPAWLLVLAAAAPLAAWALERRERRRVADLAAFADRPLLDRSASLPEGRRAAIGRGLAVLALALALLALARPQLGGRAEPLTRTGRDVLFVLDLSRSMNVRDVAPSRLEAAKAAIREVLRGSPGDRVGLLVFAGSAFVQLPFTLDRSAFEFFLHAANTEDVADTGSDLGAAMTTAATAFGREVSPNYRVAVLVSDGENLEGSLGDAVAQLRHQGVRTFAIGVGTPEGGPVPLPPERSVPAEDLPDASVDSATASGAPRPASEPGYRRDESGSVVRSRLRESTLARIAEETGGVYVRYDGGPEIRQRLLPALSRLARRRVSSRSLNRLADRFQWPLALALTALAVEGLLRDRPPRRPIETRAEFTLADPSRGVSP